MTLQLSRGRSHLRVLKIDWYWESQNLRPAFIPTQKNHLKHCYGILYTSDRHAILWQDIHEVSYA
jgi:hypothetical protein